MEKPEFNLPLLRKAVEWVAMEAAKPPREREWFQARWHDQRSCGTTYCVAGYVCEISGGEWTSSISSYLFAEEGEAEVSSTVVAGREAVSAWDRAAHLLGITQLESGALFSAENNSGMVRRLATQIAKNHGEEL